MPSRIKPAVIKLLQSGEALDKHQAAAKVFCSTKMSQQTLKQLHVAGEVHIARWKREVAGPPHPIYRWGEGRDAKRPEPPSNSETMRRQRANPEFRAKINFNRRVARSVGRHVTLGIWGL